MVDQTITYGAGEPILSSMANRGSILNPPMKVLSYFVNETTTTSHLN